MSLPMLPTSPIRMARPSRSVCRRRCAATAGTATNRSRTRISRPGRAGKPGGTGYPCRQKARKPMQATGQQAISAVSRSPMAALLIVGLGTSVVPLDSAVNIGFPAIVAHFGLPIPMIQWVVIAYVLTQTALMLTFGRVGDMLGYRRIFLFGTGVSAVAFLGCALAPSYAALLLARIVQGIGAGLILSCGPALATSLFPEAMRSRILGTYMMMFGIGFALGPAVFGVLVDAFGWSA